MTSVDFRNHDNMQSKLLELEKIKLGTEVSLGQMFEAINFKVKWFLTKKYCYTVHRVFPEFDLHHRLLKVALAELDDIEYL